LWVVPPEGLIGEGDTIEIPDRVNRIKPGAELTAVIGEPIYTAVEESREPSGFHRAIEQYIGDTALRKIAVNRDANWLIHGMRHVSYYEIVEISGV
jgi:hypothetical protein